MVHTSITQNCTVFLLRRELSPSAIYGSQNFDSHKWPTVLVDELKRKPRNFKAYLRRSLYSTFKTSFYQIILQQTVTERFSKTSSTDPRQRVPPFKGT